jgi:hypothetical protein
MIVYTNLFCVSVALDLYFYQFIHFPSGPAPSYLPSVQRSVRAVCMEYHYRISYIVQELPFVIDYTAATQDKKNKQVKE